MRQSPLPTRACKHCRTPFLSRPYRAKGKVVWTLHCSWACKAITIKTQNAGKPLEKAIAARSALARQRWAARLGVEFGPLSDRELALLKLVQRQAYCRGYSKAASLWKHAA